WGPPPSLSCTLDEGLVPPVPAARPLSASLTGLADQLAHAVGTDPGRVPLLHEREDLRPLDEGRHGNHITRLGAFEHPGEGMHLVGESRDCFRPAVDGTGPQTLHQVLAVAPPQIVHELGDRYVIGAACRDVRDAVQDLVRPVPGRAEGQPDLPAGRTKAPAD